MQAEEAEKILKARQFCKVRIVMHNLHIKICTLKSLKNVIVFKRFCIKDFSLSPFALAGFVLFRLTLRSKGLMRRSFDATEDWKRILKEDRLKNDKRIRDNFQYT